jgi:hypothetical protein
VEGATSPRPADSRALACRIAELRNLARMSNPGFAVRHLYDEIMQSEEREMGYPQVKYLGPAQTKGEGR